MKAEWRIEMLGGLRAIRGDQVVTRFRTRRVASLLAYLASFKHRAHSRDLLADLLWPDADLDVSRRYLREALYALRKVLEPEADRFGRVLLTVQDGIQLNPQAIETDVEEFEEWIEQGRAQGSIETLKKAVEVYRGPLLPGFNDSWASLEQIRLEDLYLFALAQLGDQQEPAAAINSLREGLKVDPDNPRWHTRLIERYIEMGQPARAEAQLAELELSVDGEHSRLVADLSRQIQAAKQLGLAVPKAQVSLPVVANRFFGRVQEIEAIVSLLENDESRLITLQGPAGVGKSRLAIECGKAIAEKLGWNVVFVPMADRMNDEELFEAIVSALQGGHASPRADVPQIVRLVKGKPTLLILDNLEQIASHVGARVSLLLAAGPALRFLGTSREPLRIPEEQLFQIEPLPLPGENWRRLNQLEAVPSVQLFLDRCRALRPDVRLDRRNAQIVADLCARFDGLPLAIEIAAGLSASFSISQMVRHLPDRQTEILNRRRDAPARHQSLKAAIDWGFLSLPPELCQLFLRLSVFRGSFGLDAAKAICLDGEGSIVNEINSLVEHSLVRRHPGDEDLAPRFSLLVAFREYAEHRNSAVEIARLSEAHAEYFAGRTPPDRPYRSVEEQTSVHLEIEADYQNLVAALEYSISVENFPRAIDLLATLSVRWLTRGPKVAERQLIRTLAEHPLTVKLDPERRVRLLRMTGTTFIRSREYEAAYESCAEAVRIAKDSGDAQLLATCFSGLSVCAEYLNRLDECAALNRQVLELVGDANLALAERAHLGIGSVSLSKANFEGARDEFARARRFSERLRGGEPDALVVINQAEAALGMKQVDVATRLAHEAVRISKRLRDDFTLAMGLTVLAKCQLDRGMLPAALATNLEALDRFRKGSFVYWTLRSLRNYAVVLSQLGRFSEAATLLSMTAEVAFGPETPYHAEEELAMEAIRAGMPSDAYEAASAKGLGMGLEEALDALFAEVR